MCYTKVTNILKRCASFRGNQLSLCNKEEQNKKIKILNENKVNWIYIYIWRWSLLSILSYLCADARLDFSVFFLWNYCIQNEYMTGNYVLMMPVSAHMGLIKVYLHLRGSDLFWELERTRTMNLLWFRISLLVHSINSAVLETSSQIQINRRKFFMS